jgi:protein-disulfide isomerase
MRIVRTIGLVALVSAVPAAAQASDAPCAAINTQALPPCDAPAAKAPLAVLASFEDVSFTAADLDDTLRKRAEGVDTAVAEARRRALDAEIADVRLHLEAERRGVPFRDFWEAEVLRKTPRPSDADINAQFEQAKKWYPGKTLSDLRPRIEGVVAAANREKREAEVAASLKERVPLTPGADPNAPGLAPDAVLATVGGRKITAGSAATRLDAAAFGVRRHLYYDEKGAVEKAVGDRLLKAEAEKRGLTPEALRKAEIDDRVVSPTAEEITRAYVDVYGTGPVATEEALKPIAERLREERTDELEAAFEKKLREGHAISVRIPEPAPHALALEVAGAPSRGPANAPVTVVEYADFECPFCSKAWAAAEEALKPYGDRVRYVFRDFPLPFHEHGAKAAEAGAAAHAQGRFFELANLMFKNQKALDTPSLKKYAAEAGCDPARFAADLDNGRYTADVLLEARGGERVGVAGTPMFFVNGVWLKWESTDVAGIRAAVDAALAKAGVRASAPAPAKSASP